jgi:hypothetical protein
MNMKSLTVVFGALTSFALAACTVTNTTAGVGGNGGEAAGVGGSGGSGGGTTTTVTSTGTGSACDPAYTCAEAITPPDNDGTKVCDGPAGDAYDAYYKCVCDSTGPCGTVCGTAYCTGTPATADCTTCLQDISEKGCKKQADECATN